MRVHALGNVVEITVGPTLLTRDVNALEARLRPLAGAVDVLVVDLANARRVDDFVVASLAEAVHGLAPTVEFRGLSLHHQRMLRYLGHDPAGVRGTSSSA
jgi:hypothetical protein